MQSESRRVINLSAKMKGPEKDENYNLVNNDAPTAITVNTVSHHLSVTRRNRLNVLLHRSDTSERGGRPHELLKTYR